MTPALPDLVGNIRTLYPEADIGVVRTGRRRGSRASDPGDRHYRVVVSARRPRLLVPDDAPQAAAQAVRRTSARDTAGRRRARALLSAVVASPVRRWALGPVVAVNRNGFDVEHYLARALRADPDDLSLAVAIGAARANRKPVLDVLTRTGHRLAFAKVGTSALANRLVLAETRALRLPAVAGLRHCDHPTVLHEGLWGGHEVVALTPLPTEPTHRDDRTCRLPLTAMRELSGIHGISVGRLSSSTWLASVRDDAARLTTPLGRRLRSAVLAFAATHGDRALRFGAWHGDWGPWNMAWVGGRPQVWDWERFGRDVPVGFDAVHFVGHRSLRQVGKHDLAEDALDGPAARAVALMGVSDPHDVRATIDAYLLEIARRYASDAAEPSGAPVARAAGWFLDVLQGRCPAFRKTGATA